jgi:Cys-rich repeat protein
MDGERFDSLIKRLGTTRLTRLAALRGLAVGAVASVTGLSLLGQEAEAAERKRRRKRRICHRTSATDPGVTKKLKAKRAKRHLRKHQFDTKGACTAAAPGSTTTINLIGCRNDADCGVGRFCVGGICVQCRSDADCGAGRVCVGNVCNFPVTVINPPPNVIGLEICRQQGNICVPDEEFCCTAGPKTALCVNNPQACNPGSSVPA